MSNEPQLPIIVGPSAIPDTLKAFLRQTLLAIGAWAVGKGYVNAENLEGVVTAALGIIAALWGLYATFRRKSQLVVTAEASPNAIAQVKS